MKRFCPSWHSIALVLACAWILLGCGRGASTHASDAGSTGQGATSTSASSSGMGTGGAGATGGAGGAAPVTDLFADALGGDDTNPGTEQKPFKTLTHALSVATAGQSVHLYSGTYDANNGETFPEQVPDGVSVEAATAGGAAIVGQAGATGLQFIGSGTLRYAQVQGFGRGVEALTGKVTIDTVGFLQDGYAISIQQGTASAVASAEATLTGCEIAGGGSAFTLDGAAQLTISGGEIHDLGPSCHGGVGVGEAGGASIVTLVSVSVHDIEGDLDLRDASLATIENSMFANVGGGACGYDAIRLDEASSLNAENTTVSGAAGQDDLILVLSSGSVTLTNATLTMTTSGDGIDIEGDAEVTVNGTTLTGVVAPMSGGFGVSVSSPGAQVTLTNTMIDSFYEGLEMSAGHVTLRNTTLTHGTFGVAFDGGSLDLGTASDPGGNVLQTNTAQALSVGPPMSTTMNAVGNTWIPNVQGADANGQYASGTVSGPYGLTASAPCNLVIWAAGSKVVH